MNMVRWAAAGILAGAIAATGAASAQEKPAAAQSKIEDLAWLAGTWRSEHDGNVYEEHWLQPAGGTMAGVFRSVEGGKPDMYEILAIETLAEGGLAMRLRHFGPGLAPWKSEGAETPTWTLRSAEKKLLIFEDPAKEFPRRIAYRLLDDSTLGIRLDAAEGSSRKPLVFQLKRAK